MLFRSKKEPNTYNLKPKVGHAGTLDPFATGLLIVGVGRDATKRLDEFKGMKKEYIATIRLGATSDTFDRTGTIQETNHKKQTISKSHISNVLNSFIGKQSQLPPMYSAKKVGGKKLYELARKGIEIERQPSEIEMYEIELLEMKTLPPSRGELEGGSSQVEQTINIHNAQHRIDTQPIDTTCDCYTCTHHTRAYLHHLFKAEELLAYRLATIHNLRFLMNMMREMRTAIQEDRFLEMKKLWCNG